MQDLAVLADEVARDSPPEQDRGCMSSVCGKHVRAWLQTSAASGAMKEELNNTLLSCLAEEAKSAHAAQEAIEFCRAAGPPRSAQAACIATCTPASGASLACA